MPFQEQWPSRNGGWVTTRPGSMGVASTAFPLGLCSLAHLDFETPCSGWPDLLVPQLPSLSCRQGLAEAMRLPLTQ